MSVSVKKNNLINLNGDEDEEIHFRFNDIEDDIIVECCVIAENNGYIHEDWEEGMVEILSGKGYVFLSKAKCTLQTEMLFEQFMELHKTLGNTLLREKLDEITNNL